MFRCVFDLMCRGDSLTARSHLSMAAQQGVEQAVVVLKLLDAQEGHDDAMVVELVHQASQLGNRMIASVIVFKVGRRAQLDNLQSAAGKHLNGCDGTITRSLIIRRVSCSGDVV